MKRTPFTARWLVISFVILLALSACERPIQRDDLPDTTDVVEPTTSPIVIPTAIPTEGSDEDVSDVPEGDQTEEPGSDTQTPAEEPETDAPAEPADEVVAPSEPETTETSYTVQAGDTLGNIAQVYGLTLEELAAANNISNIHTLDVGQVLVIPVPGTVEIEAPPVQTESEEERTHVVLAGENLYRIGLVYGFTAEELAGYNGIANINQIDVGQIIRIPASQP